MSDDRPDHPAGPKQAAQRDRQARLAAALRQNLRRRKTAPGKADTTAPAAPDSGGDPPDSSRD